MEREKAIALQKELERAAKEKERRELEEKRRLVGVQRPYSNPLNLASQNENHLYASNT